MKTLEEIHHELLFPPMRVRHRIVEGHPYLYIEIQLPEGNPTGMVGWHEVGGTGTDGRRGLVEEWVGLGGRDITPIMTEYEDWSKDD